MNEIEELVKDMDAALDKLDVLVVERNRYKKALEEIANLHWLIQDDADWRDEACKIIRKLGIKENINWREKRKVSDGV